MDNMEIEKIKPTSVYVFGILFFIYYLLCFGISIWFIIIPEIIVTNIFFFGSSVLLIIIGFISSMILLFSKKYKIVKISFNILATAIILGTLISFVSSLMSAVKTSRPLLAVILLVIFCNIKSFKYYFLFQGKKLRSR